VVFATDAAIADTAPVTSLTIGGKRPAEVFIPPNVVKPAPLIVMLHAYGANASIEEWFFRFHSHTESRGFVYVTPEGTPNAEGKQYWNATDACCAPPPNLVDGGTPPDDVQYLRELVGEVISKVEIDTKRIYVVGHSNGGFMAHRLACDHPELFAAIVSVAGATWASATKCKPSTPVSVLQIHGTADATISIDGGMFFGNVYPSARATVEHWVGNNDCTKFPIEDPKKLDLDVRVGGKETSIKRWVGCRANTEVELWTMHGSSHVPLTSANMAPAILDWLFAHPKP
jgi:polyhydroxybutyrate depolymerase